MKSALNAAFAYRTPKSLMIVGRLHKGPESTGGVLMDVSPSLDLKVRCEPKQRIINHQSEISLCKVYGGYYNKESMEKAFCQRNLNVLDRDPYLFIDTYILIVDQPQSVAPLDLHSREVAVILAGKSARMIYKKLALASKVTRILDLPSASTVMGRRLRESKLSFSTEGDDGAGWRDKANQRYVTEPTRMSGKDFPI